MKKVKKPNLSQVVTVILFATLLGSIAYSIVHIVTADAGQGTTGREFTRVKSDYTLMLLQCLLGIFAMFLPSIIEKRLNLKIPSKIYLTFLIFLYCAIYLGEVRNFYFVIPHWDVVLHAFSSIMFGALGIFIVHVFNQHENINIKLSPLFVCVFGFCFAMTIEVIWEIYEFSFDGIFGLNMQKFRAYDGTVLVGREALRDTMKDIIVDMIGAFGVTAVTYFGLSSQKKREEK